MTPAPGGRGTHARRARRLPDPVAAKVPEVAALLWRFKGPDGWAQDEIADQARGVQAQIGWTLGPRFYSS